MRATPGRLLVACGVAFGGLLATLRIGAKLRTPRPVDALFAGGLFGKGADAVCASLAAGRTDLIARRAEIDAALRDEWSARFPDVVRAQRVWMITLAPLALSGSDPPLGARFSPLDWPRWTRELDRFLAPGLTARGASDLSAVLARSENLAGLLLPRAAIALEQTDARASLARIALAACAHHEAHGAWPATSADLAPLFPDGVPVDPFTGQPFELRIEDGTLVLRATPWGVAGLRGVELEEMGLLRLLPAPR